MLKDFISLYYNRDCNVSSCCSNSSCCHRFVVAALIFEWWNWYLGDRHKILAEFCSQLSFEKKKEKKFLREFYKRYFNSSFFLFFCRFFCFKIFVAFTLSLVLKIFLNKKNFLVFSSWSLFNY